MDLLLFCSDSCGSLQWSAQDRVQPEHTQRSQLSAQSIEAGSLRRRKHQNRWVPAHKQTSTHEWEDHVVKNTNNIWDTMHAVVLFCACRSRDQLCPQGTVSGVSGDEAERSSRAGPGDRWKSPGWCGTTLQSSTCSRSISHAVCLHKILNLQDTFYPTQIRYVIVTMPKEACKLTEQCVLMQGVSRCAIILLGGV